MKRVNLLRCTANTIVAISLILVTLSFALADENGKISLQEILTHKSIRVGDLKKLSLAVKQGHGPVMWSTVDAKREVWFWYKPGITAALDMGEIVLIANVIPNDENNGTIIWPKDKVGHDYGKELDVLYNEK